MQTILIILAFVSGLAAAFGVLVLCIKPRCRICDQNIARAGAAEGKAAALTSFNDNLTRTNERLLLTLGVPRLEKTPEEIEADKREAELLKDAEERERKGGKTYGT